MDRSGSGREPTSRWRRPVLLGWALLSVTTFLPSCLYYLSERQDVPWSRLWSEMLAWLLWVPLLPLVLWTSHRFPLERQAWRRSVPAHLVMGLVVAVLYAVLLTVKNQVIVAATTQGAPPPFLSILEVYLVGGFQLYFLVYWMIVVAAHALDYYRKYRERELRAAQLEARLTRAQLQVLKMQLDPHFLFNTLNAISVLVHRDPDAADRMICMLSDFLRSSLRSADREQVLLEEELAFLEQYLAIQKARFGERLAVEIDVEPDALSALVPNLILQPLVENSIRHGMSRKGPLTVVVRARLLGRRKLGLEVIDDGAGLPPGSGRGVGLREGIGLSNTRARLRQLYNTDHQFGLANRAGGGVVVTLVLPRRIERPDSPPAPEAPAETVAEAPG
jgi:two-component system, LytTR family, sensor kinase